MTKFSTTLIGIGALAALTASPVMVAAHQEESVQHTLSIAEFAGASGDDWTGTLSYLDYTSGKPATIPAKLALELRGKRTVRYTISYPYEGSRNDTSSWKISRDGRAFGGTTIIARSPVGEMPLVVTTQEPGQDDYRDAAIRMTYTLGTETITVRKDVKFVGETEFFNRNQFSFTR